MTPLVVFINSGYYYGYEVELLHRVDLGELGVWYYTDNIENEYCCSYDMWFKEGQFEIIEEEDET